MKLLEPRAIQSNLNVERKKDIDNGLQLARKVDTMRDNLSKEEANWNTFRDVTTKEILLQIDTKIKERDALVSEITVLEKERKELLIPLDKEWELVKEEKQKLIEKGNEIDSLKKQLITSNEDIAKSRQEFAIEEKRQSDIKEQLQKESKNTSEALAEASRTLSGARNEEKRVYDHVSEKMRELGEREDVLMATINSLEIRESRIEKAEQEIINEKIRIADQYATLERAFARLKI